MCPIPVKSVQAIGAKEGRQDPIRTGTMGAWKLYRPYFLLDPIALASEPIVTDSRAMELPPSLGGDAEHMCTSRYR